MRKIVLVAGDYAQSEVLRTLGEQLSGADCHLQGLLCYGKPPEFPPDKICKAIHDANWLVAGMSERSVEEVVAIHEAIKQDVRIALYADTFDAHHLPAFEFARGLALTIFVINEEEAADARKLFPKADVRVTGNPRWEAFAFPTLSRNEARLKLGINDGRRVILSPGDKYLAQNMIQFGAVIEAVQTLGWGDNTEIIFGLHPGDLNAPKLYDELVANAGCSVRIIGKHVGINTGEILPACGSVVQFTSTIGVQAACLRIPVFEFCSTIALRGEKPEIGVSPWRLVKSGAAIPIYYGSSPRLAEMMRDVENTVRGTDLRAGQERMFPVPPADGRGRAIKLMCEALK